MNNIIQAARASLNIAAETGLSRPIVAVMNQIAHLTTPFLFDDTALETAVWAARQVERADLMGVMFGRRLVGEDVASPKLTNLTRVALENFEVTQQIKTARFSVAPDLESGQTLVVADMYTDEGPRTVFVVSENTIGPHVMMFGAVAMEFKNDPYWADRALSITASSRINQRDTTELDRLTEQCEQEMQFDAEDLADKADIGYGPAAMQASMLVNLLDDINSMRGMILMSDDRRLPNADGGWDKLDPSEIEAVIDYYVTKQNIMKIMDTLCGFVLSPELPTKDAVHSLAASVRQVFDAFQEIRGTIDAWSKAVHVSETIVPEALRKAAE